MSYFNDEFAKILEDQEIKEKSQEWIEINGGEGMPVFNAQSFFSYKDFKRAFLKEYKKIVRSKN